MLELDIGGGSGLAGQPSLEVQQPHQHERHPLGNDQTLPLESEPDEVQVQLTLAVL